jgi:hypothetical protein
MSRLLPLEYYENSHNTNFPNNSIKILYRQDKYLYFNTEFGLCKKGISNFHGETYNIQSAINKTEFAINKLVFIYKDKYDYSLVKFNKTVKNKVILICKEHGNFKTILSQAFNGKAICPICSKLLTKEKTSYTKEQFVEKANIVHNNKYDYSNTVYNLSTKTVEIRCLNHGYFTQRAQTHLMGHGCPECANDLRKKLFSENPTGWGMNAWKKAGQSSKKFDSFKVYIIKCWNNEEEFYKIGRTFLKITKRFGYKVRMPYNYSIEKIYESNSEDIYDLEVNLKKLNKEFKYIPKIEFHGMYECFSKIEYLN